MKSSRERSSKAAPKGGAKQTPMMAQYLKIKGQHQDALLMFRMGDFYETFYEDAEVVSGILGITLTAREKNSGNPVPLAGIPYHALEHYLVKLLDAGRTVAICEQVEDPAQAKGLVRREVVEVISPGTVTNPALLRGEDNCFLLAIQPSGDDHWGYALLDGSTGEFRCGQGPPGEVLALPRRYSVAEILVPETAELDAEWDESNLKQASPMMFEGHYAEEALEDHFGTRGVAGLGLTDLPEATRAAGAALRYLAERQRARPRQVDRLIVDHAEDRMHLDRETVAHLELFEGLRGDAETSLFRHLNATRTPMGRRRLAAWMRGPLTDPAAIARRHDAVEWLSENRSACDGLRDALRGMGDLERVVSRIATARVAPNELAQLRDGLLRLPAAREAVTSAPAKGLLSEGARRLVEADQLAEPLQQSLMEAPPTHLRTGGVFQDGVDSELDRLRELSSGGKTWIAGYQEQERERTGIATLKVGYNKVFGYYLEVTNKHLDKVPEDYLEKQRLAGGKRFVTPALKEREQSILSAEEDKVEREAQLFREFVAGLADKVAPLREVIGVAADLDVLGCLAEVATSRRYVRPLVDTGDVIAMEEARHPVVERLVGSPFVSNDVRLDPKGRQLLLLTGPNMGGKSTYLRQVAVLVVMAQMGSFVPATHAQIGVVDRLFTRVGASDNLARGQSTFLVEMAETANILRNATPRSLVILDEVGRGTSTEDGLAIAWAMTEYLIQGPVRPKTIFATHFHELTDVVDGLVGGENIQMDVKEWEGKILFLHRVAPGASDRSYGVHVAELAGVPAPVLRRAEELLARGRQPTPTPEPHETPPPPAPQLDLFSGPQRAVLDRLAALQPDQLRPVEALQLLDELVQELKRGQSGG